jgi:hypothetical protein
MEFITVVKSFKVLAIFFPFLVFLSAKKGFLALDAEQKDSEYARQQKAYQKKTKGLHVKCFIRLAPGFL